MEFITRERLGRHGRPPGRAVSSRDQCWTRVRKPVWTRSRPSSRRRRPPAPGIGPDEPLEFWPLVVRAGWFLAGFVAVFLPGWHVVEPAISRAIRRRTRNDPTLQAAISRYVPLLVPVIGFFVGPGTAGYGRFPSDSALVIAAGTLAIGVAG